MRNLDSSFDRTLWKLVPEQRRQECGKAAGDERFC